MSKAGWTRGAQTPLTEYFWPFKQMVVHAFFSTCVEHPPISPSSVSTVLVPKSSLTNTWHLQASLAPVLQFGIGALPVNVFFIQV